MNYTNCYEKCKYYFYYNNETNKYYCTEEQKCPIEYNKLKIENNECIEDCKIDNLYKYEFQKKCYSKCPNNTILSESKDYYCEPQCSKEFPFELVTTQQCVSNCSISDRQNNLCIINYISEDKEESVSVKDEVISNIREDLTNNFNTSDIDEAGDIIIEEKGMKVTITSTENQKENEKNPNITTIDLGECETKLKEYYKIPLDKSLYILKLDVNQEGMKIPKIEYEVYYNLNGKNLEKLNLSVCSNMKIDISIPAEINDDLDKLNKSSGYYNDICYTSTTEDGTDISLEDRKKEFIDNNKTLCEENCEFTQYNYETGKVVCSCNIKINLPLVSEINIDKNKFFDSFIDFNHVINYKIMKCYKNLLNKKRFFNNFGSFILIPVIIFHFISVISVCVSGNKYIKHKIKEIVIAKNEFKLLEEKYNKYNILFNDLTKKDKKSKKKNIKKKKLNKKYAKTTEGNIEYNAENKRKNVKNNNKNNVQGHKRIKYIEIKDRNEIINSPPIKSRSKKFKKQKQNNSVLKTLNTGNDEIPEHSRKNSKIKKSNTKEDLVKDAKKYIEYKKILKPNENELNSLSYKKALNLDKRKYWGYYCSLLKENHLLLFSFLPRNDYNLKITKIDLFFINFAMNFTVNALFFNDSTMHKIYEDCGEFNFNYQITQILYSSIISLILFSILRISALTENNVLAVKHQKKGNLNVEKIKTYKMLTIKFISFVFISFIMLFAFFYYLACFCVIYKNTQIHLIKDTLISFGLSLIFPFFTCLIPGLFRIPALSNKNNKREALYKFSKFIEILAG